jgi:hypothetical protein
MDVDPLAGKADAGKKRLHNRTGDAKKRHGAKTHGDDEKGLVMIFPFHKNPADTAQIGCGAGKVLFCIISHGGNDVKQRNIQI